MEVWNLTHLYETREDWDKDLLKLKKKIESLKEINVLASKETLINFLRDLSDCYELVERVYIYPRRLLDLNNEDKIASEMFNKAVDAYNAYLVVENYYKKVFVENKKIVHDYIKTSDYWYRYMEIILRKGSHIPEDRVLSEYNILFPSIRKKYLNILNEKLSFDPILINGEMVDVSKKNYNTLLENENQDIRHKVFTSYMMGFVNKQSEIKDLYQDKILNDIRLYRSEGYNSLLEKKLYELELDTSVVIDLIKMVNKNLEIMHEYVKLKKKISGLDEFHTYDSSAAILKDNPSKIEFDESVEMVKEALRPLGDEYVCIIDKALEEGWIDVYPKDHKRSNTSTSICYNGVPYILMNYTKNMVGTRSLAHELGHAIHVYYSVKNNKMEYFEFDLFLTEIVSKVNEILFNEYLLSKANNDEERKEVLNNIVGSLGNSLFNQMMITEFEDTIIKELEKNESIDIDYLNTKYLEMFKKYNGDSLTIDELNQYGWLRETNLIWQESYYLYQYSIGLILGINIALKILSDNTYVSKYQKLLSAGRSLPIEDALKLVDIDIYDEKMSQVALDYFNNKMEQFKKLVLK